MFNRFQEEGQAIYTIIMNEVVFTLYVAGANYNGTKCRGMIRNSTVDFICSNLV